MLLQQIRARCLHPPAAIPSFLRQRATALSLLNARRTFTTQPESGSYIHLATRGLLEIHGKDASKFLQGLITNHMPRIEQGGSGFLAAFLSPKGRVMYDVFVHPLHGPAKETGAAEPAYLIECDARALPELHSHIARFVLRSKVKLVGVTESYDVYSALEDDPVVTPLTPSTVGANNAVSVDEGSVQSTLGSFGATIGLKDTRADGLMGYRFILPKGQKPTMPETYRVGKLEDYHVRRILNGIPEGIDDFIAGASLPLECNLDYMRGVDFRKGCYVGQELTIRTYHKGIVRKRIMPVQYYKPEDPEPRHITYKKGDASVVPPQSELHPAKIGSTLGDPTSSTSSARPVRASGKTGSNIGNIGLALLKLDQVAEGQLFEVMDREGATVRAKAFFPSWWPQEEPTEQQEN
ncbi:ccr4 associated factor [Actinomortierella ambigua]|uniref:Ccr4 associated factor n=1 Tax=Actinomortierella ambigua TaxID=1343610 RepID=A0A9P6Q157_9FUNG|nr:ccr4 associated factor [Actinomortierella ambigua]